MNLLNISFYFYNKHFFWIFHTQHTVTYFSHFHSDIVKAVSGCQTGLPWQRYAPYSSSNHKSVFLSHQRLLFPLTLQLKDVVKTEGMDPFSFWSGHWGPRCLTTPRGQILLLSQICNPVNTFLRTLCLAKIYLHIFLCFENEKLSQFAAAAVVSSISRVQTSLMKFQNPDHQSEAMSIFYSDCDWQAVYSLERI